MERLMGLEPTTICMASACDLVYGGGGADVIDGGAGNDVVWGGTGRDEPADKRTDELRHVLGI
jgi:Ca2+-binding RTX toxin-like protein